MGDDRTRTGRHDDVLRGVAGALDPHHACPRQPSDAPQQADAPVRQPALLTRI